MFYVFKTILIYKSSRFKSFCFSITRVLTRHLVYSRFRICYPFSRHFMSVVAFTSNRVSIIIENLKKIFSVISIYVPDYCKYN